MPSDSTYITRTQIQLPSSADYLRMANDAERGGKPKEYVETLMRLADEELRREKSERRMCELAAAKKAAKDWKTIAVGVLLLPAWLLVETVRAIRRSWRWLREATRP